jgi:hypothetical protein
MRGAAQGLGVQMESLSDVGTAEEFEKVESEAWKWGLLAMN